MHILTIKKRYGKKPGEHYAGLRTHRPKNSIASYHTGKESHQVQRKPKPSEKPTINNLQNVVWNNFLAKIHVQKHIRLRLMNIQNHILSENKIVVMKTFELKNVFRDFERFVRSGVKLTK